MKRELEKTGAVTVMVILVSFLLSAFLYPRMPDSMVSRWNLQGVPNSYLPKPWVLFLMPVTSVVLVLLFLAIPRIDPLKKNIQKFRKEYNFFILILVCFLSYLHVIVLVANAGVSVNVPQMLAPGFAVLFYYTGILLEKAKQNWFIGIRTPWTLSNKKVWDKTHRLGGKLLRIAGLIAVVGVLVPNSTLLFVLIPVLLFSAYLVVYSYVEYHKIKK